MSVSAEYLDYLRELLAPLGRITSRRMFGSVGLYCDGLFFAIVSDDLLYLKVDAETRADFEREGLEAFSYELEGRIATMNYYRAPDEAMDSSGLMRPWAERAIAAALRARKPKDQKNRKRKPEAAV